MNETTLFWLIPLVLIVFMIGISSLLRLKVPRDITKEGEDNQDTVRAYDSVSRWLLFDLIRYRVLSQLKQYPPQGMLLDAGCGPGYLDRAIIARYPQLKILGIDISKDMLELAVGNLASSKNDSSINYQEADVQSLPFNNNYVDFVISTLSMHHLARPKEALKEIFRVLKPGGQLLIFDLRRDMPWALFGLICFGQRFLAPSPIRKINGGVGSVWSSFTPAEVKNLLSDSPFQSWKIQRGWGWYYVWGKK
jgi:ubiquinone/menaquinone biosynthesis C-methylase UbiE